MWGSDLRFSMDAAAADYESYLEDAARNLPESDPDVPLSNIRARAAVMRGIARLQGDEHVWAPGERRDARAAMAEFDRALALFRDDARAAAETRLRRQYAAALAGDAAAAQSLQRGTGPGLAGMLAGLVAVQRLVPQPDTQAALAALAGAVEREGGERIRVRDTRDALRALVALRAELPDQGPRVAAVFDRYIAISRFPSNEVPRIRTDFAEAAAGRLPAALAQGGVGRSTTATPMVGSEAPQAGTSATAPVARAGAATTSATAATAPAAASAAALAVFAGRSDEAQVLTYINTMRANGANCLGTRVPAAPALAWDDRLARMASALATEKVAPRGTDSGSLEAQLERAGYRWQAAERLEVADKAAAIEVLMGLLPDAGRCTKILSAQYTRAAVAAASKDGATGPAQWVVILARPAP
jgi:uncharacterized protein YkwD